MLVWLNQINSYTQSDINLTGLLRSSTWDNVQ